MERSKMDLNKLKTLLGKDIKGIKAKEKEFPTLREDFKLYNKAWINCLEYVVRLIENP